jgi:hypothetical protein
MEQWINGGATKKTSVQPLEKLTANGKTYLRAGTAELNLYLRTVKNFSQKLDYIFYATAEDITHFRKQG